MARRCQSLQRFLLEQLHRELAQRARPAQNPGPNPAGCPDPSPGAPSSPPAGAEPSAAAANGAAPAAKLEQDGLPGAGSGLGSGPDAATVVQQLFQLAAQQRTLFLSGTHRSKPGLVRLHLAAQSRTKSKRLNCMRLTSHVQQPGRCRKCGGCI